MKKLKIRQFLLCTALAAGILGGSALAVVGPKADNRWVADYAGVIDQDTEEYIAQKNINLSQACGGEIVVVAVDFMDGMSSTDYAMQVAENWGGIGDANRDNGFILAYAVGENKVRALSGSGIMKDLTSSKMENMLVDYFYDDYDAGEYDTATRNMFDAVYSWYEGYYGSAAGGTVIPEAEEYHSGAEGIIAVLIPLILLVIVAVIVVDSSRYNRYRRRYCMPGMPPPPFLYRPFIFGWGGRRYYRRFGSYPPYIVHTHTHHPGGDFTHGGSFRGGGAGRDDDNHPFGGFGGGGFGGGGFSGGGFSGGSFGGGSFRGGGAGRG